jgi:hypothetical protein
VKPSVTIDERGILLHVTDTEGKGVAVPLNAETVREISHALERLKAPETRSQLFKNVAHAIAQTLLGTPENKADGTPEPDPTRKTDR